MVKVNNGVFVVKKTYYVIKKGNVVEEAKNLFDYLVLKLGLEKLIDQLVVIFQTILSQVKTLVHLEAVINAFREGLSKIIVAIDLFQLGQIRTNSSAA